ncbi:MAG: hypothetical protein ACD_36C00152G0004 [uncultured bacterium]|uniref:Carotenoid biosynthesis protein n=1 Tax=Candidatus Gottesmanbacteria bacterium RIFCSPLOWO2_01_FULL_43_11b TaxID=1798392 RepID=A0A1F6AHH5_9BACT|nr:MAG: hypothetical protein ACD_36C00152G0004 [uncultured bacterium]OGG24145.1 MAG: hypothetical protein A3A79_03060 [Candidatus Gottesmanbacteria bacterium RIFCSPLOWO2_01_FULL_43_11b]
MQISLLMIIIVILWLVPALLDHLTGKFIYVVVAALVAIIAHGIYFFGPHILYLLLITYVISTVAELVALKTPINCFGVRYWYNIKNPFFSSKVNYLGVYPLEISLAWVIFKYMSFILALLITSAFSLSPPWIIVLTPLILVSLDFIIDPVSVHTGKLWQWEKGSFYFGIPLRNFLGWYVVGFISTLLFTLIDQGKPVTFHILYVLPILFYASVLKRVPAMMKLNRRLAILGSLPVVFWVGLGLVSLYTLI